MFLVLLLLLVKDYQMKLSEEKAKLMHPGLVNHEEKHIYNNCQLNLWVEKIELMLLSRANHSYQMRKHLFLFLNQLMHLPKHYKVRLSAVQVSN